MSIFAVALATLVLSADRTPPAEEPPPAETPPPHPLIESGVFTSTGYNIIMTIDSVGNWLTASNQGKLEPEELQKITASADKVVLTTSAGNECPRTEPVIQLLRVPRGEVRFAVLCGPKAHPSVAELLQLADSLTSRRPTPTVVQLDRWPPGKASRKQVIILKRTGRWSIENGFGQTGGPELDAVIAAFEEAVLEVTPNSAPADCPVTWVNEIDVPHRGKLKWMAPCQTPSPTLAAALAKLFALVGSSNE